MNRVAWLGDRYWAMAEGGGVFTSTNGNQWTAQTTGATNDLYCAAGSGTNVVLVSGNNEVRLRILNEWNNESRSNKTNPPPVWPYYSSLWDGSSFWLGGESGLWVEGSRTNQVGEFDWSEIGDSSRDWIWSVCRTPYFYLAAGDRGTLLTSDNGIDWEMNLVPEPLTNTVFLGVGFNSNCFLALGNSGAMALSTNGISWSAVEPRPTTNDLQGFAASGSTLIVSGAKGTILTSTDGSTWTRCLTPTTNFLSSLAVFPGGVAAVGDNGTLLISPNGKDWTPRVLPTTNWLYGVRYLNESLVVVGENGTIFSSQNGVEWITGSSSTSQWLTDAVFIDGYWFAVGLGGTLLASTNLTSWNNLGTATRNSLFGAATDGFQLLAVGVGGIILRSPIVPRQSAVNFASFSHTSNYNLFLFSGEPDQVFLLESSEQLPLFTPAYELEFNDGTGTLLFLEENSDSVSNRFFRTRLIP